MTTNDQQQRLLSLLLHHDEAISQQGLALVQALSPKERQQLGLAALQEAERRNLSVDPWLFLNVAADSKAGRRAHQLAYDGAAWILDFLDRVTFGNQDNPISRGRISSPVWEAFQIAGTHAQGRATREDRERALALLLESRWPPPERRPCEPPNPARVVEWVLHPDSAVASRLVAREGAEFVGWVNACYRGGVVPNLAIQAGRNYLQTWLRHYLRQQLLWGCSEDAPRDDRKPAKSAIERFEALLRARGIKKSGRILGFRLDEL